MNAQAWKRDLALLILVIAAVLVFAYCQRISRPVSPEESHAYDMTP